MELKHCIKCVADLPRQDFYRDRSKSDGLDFYCRQCRRQTRIISYYVNHEESKAKTRRYNAKHKEEIRAKQRRYHAENPDKTKFYRILHPDKVQKWKLISRVKKYGITVDQYNEMLANQSNACAICLTSFSGKIPRIDHSHSNNRVRALLCDRCNRCLGLFQDDPAIVERAAKYLRTHEQSTTESGSIEP